MVAQLLSTSLLLGAHKVCSPVLGVPQQDGIPESALEHGPPLELDSVTTNPLSPALTEGSLVLAPDLVQTRKSLQPVLDLTTSIAANSIKHASGAGVSLIAEDGTKTSTASTNPLVSLADERQYELGQGPCLDSWSKSVLIRIDDLNEDARWPQWAEAARALHLGSVLSTPLLGGTRNLGAIKVYSDKPRAFDRDAENLLLQLADLAALLVENLQMLISAERFSDSVKAALESRQLIALAQGLLVERHQLSPQAAFTRLVEDAQRHHRTAAQEATALLAEQ